MTDVKRSRLHLGDGLRQQFVHFRANLRFGDGNLFGGEIGQHLADHVGVSGGLEFGRDDVLGIGAGGVGRHAQLFRHPQAQQLVAPCLGLELLLLVERELLLETFLAFVECGHDLRVPFPGRNGEGGPRCGGLPACLDNGSKWLKQQRQIGRGTVKLVPGGTGSIVLGGTNQGG